MRTVLLTTTSEMSDHRHEWEELRRECRGTVYSSFDMVRAWFECYREDASPRVIMAEDRGELVGLAPLSYHHYVSMGLPIRVLALPGEVRHKLWMATVSFMFRPGRDDALETMVARARKVGWNTFTACHMIDNAETRRFIGAMRSRWKVVDHRMDKSVTLTFPEKGDIATMFERKARENLRNRAKKLEREKGDVSFRTLPPGEVEAAVEEYARQHEERYSKKGGSIFRSPDNIQFLKAVMRAAMDQGYGFAHELRIDGQVAAQSFGFIDGDVVRPYRFGMNDAFTAYSPGWQLHHRSFSYFRDRGMRQCSLGAGDEAYKYRMGGVESQLLGIMVRRGAIGLVDRMARRLEAGR
jgi:CelD/BcsL family acetyltransferase involved in cellulose biosynthesis